MNKKVVTLTGGIFIFLIIITLVNYWTNTSETKNEKEITTNELSNERQTGTDPENTSYYLGGEEIKLVDGKSEIKIPDSSIIITTKVFDDPVMGDLDGDGVEDAGVILIETDGKSGTFYYSAVAIKNPDDKSYVGSNAILLGDRIDPQNKEIKDSIYTVNYADRKEGEDFSTKPSVTIIKKFTFDGAGLIDEDDLLEE